MWNVVYSSEKKLKTLVNKDALHSKYNLPLGKIEEHQRYKPSTTYTSYVCQNHFWLKNNLLAILIRNRSQYSTNNENSRCMSS